MTKNISGRTELRIKKESLSSSGRIMKQIKKDLTRSAGHTERKTKKKLPKEIGRIMLRIKKKSQRRRKQKRHRFLIDPGEEVILRRAAAIWGETRFYYDT